MKHAMLHLGHHLRPCWSWLFAGIFAALVAADAGTQAVPAEIGGPGLARARLGLFVHYVCGLTPGKPSAEKITDLNRFAQALDVEALAETAKQAGAEYLIFTTYHAGMRLLYPSPLWGEIFPDKVSRRDVIGELADAARKRGLALVLYVHPNDRHDLSVADQKRLIDRGFAESVLHKDPIWLEKRGDKRYTGLRGADRKWNAFYCKLIEEIGQRYGSRLAGYWQDGPGPDGVTVRAIMEKHTPRASIWLNKAASRADLPPANLLGGEYLVKPATTADERNSGACHMQNSITITGDWWASAKPVMYPVESLYRMTVTMAATKGQAHGGFVLATGPFSDNTWAPGVADTLTAMGGLMRRFGFAIYGTLPGTAFVTTSTAKQPAWGVSTQSLDGRTVYAHVLRPPRMGGRIELGIPADGSRFTTATVGGASAILEATPAGVAVTLPVGTSWDVLDTVIALTVQR